MTSLLSEKKNKPEKLQTVWCNSLLSATLITWAGVLHSFMWAYLFVRKYSLQGHISNMFAEPL